MPGTPTEHWNDLRDSINQLVQPGEDTVLSIKWVGGHRKAVTETVPAPSLLDQMRDLANWPYRSGAEDESVRHAKGVRDAPQVDPRAQATLADLDRIREAVGSWLLPFKWLRRQPLERQLDALLLICRQCPGDVEDVAAAARSWVARARASVKWREITSRPPVRCPQCGQVELIVDWQRKAAACGSCGHDWTPQTIGILAREIEADRERSETA